MTIEMIEAGAVRSDLEALDRATRGSARRRLWPFRPRVGVMLRAFLVLVLLGFGIFKATDSTVGGGGGATFCPSGPYWVQYKSWNAYGDFVHVWSWDQSRHALRYPYCYMDVFTQTGYYDSGSVYWGFVAPRSGGGGGSW